MQALEARGHTVVIVSPSPLRPEGLGFPEFLSVDRKKNLLDAAAAYPELWPVYISDNEGDDRLSQEVWVTYAPSCGGGSLASAFSVNMHTCPCIGPNQPSSV